MLNLRLAPSGQAQYESKQTENKFLLPTFAKVHGNDGLWNISVIVNDNWTEAWEHPQKNIIYIIHWITPYVGVIIVSCKKSETAIKLCLDALPETYNLFQSAMNSLISPDEIDKIHLPTAGSGIQRSIKQLANEARFLQKKVSGQEIMDCIIRVRSRIERAERVQKDAISEIFNAARRSAQSYKLQNEKGQRGIHKAQNAVHHRKPRVSGRRVQKPIVSDPPQGRKARKSQQGGNVDVGMPIVPRKNRNRKSVGA